MFLSLSQLSHRVVNCECHPALPARFPLPGPWDQKARKDLLMQSEMTLNTKMRGARGIGTWVVIFYLISILTLAAPTTKHANLIRS